MAKLILKVKNAVLWMSSPSSGANRVTGLRAGPQEVRWRPCVGGLLLARLPRRRSTALPYRGGSPADSLTSQYRLLDFQLPKFISVTNTFLFLVNQAVVLCNRSINGARELMKEAFCSLCLMLFMYTQSPLLSGFSYLWSAVIQNTSMVFVLCRGRSQNIHYSILLQFKFIILHFLDLICKLSFITGIYVQEETLCLCTAHDLRCTVEVLDKKGLPQRHLLQNVTCY